MPVNLLNVFTDFIYNITKQCVLHFKESVIIESIIFPRPLKSDTFDEFQTNNLLSDEQIQNFITSTVLPHHRTLNGSSGRKWSHSQPGKRLTQQVSIYAHLSDNTQKTIIESNLV